MKRVDRKEYLDFLDGLPEFETSVSQTMDHITVVHYRPGHTYRIAQVTLIFRGLTFIPEYLIEE